MSATEQELRQSLVAAEMREAEGERRASVEEASASKEEAAELRRHSTALESELETARAELASAVADGSTLTDALAVARGDGQRASLKAEALEVAATAQGAHAAHWEARGVAAEAALVAAAAAAKAERRVLYNELRRVEGEAVEAAAAAAALRERDEAAAAEWREMHSVRTDATQTALQLELAALHMQLLGVRGAPAPGAAEPAAAAEAAAANAFGGADAAAVDGIGSAPLRFSMPPPPPRLSAAAAALLPPAEAMWAGATPPVTPVTTSRPR